MSNTDRLQLRAGLARTAVFLAGFVGVVLAADVLR